MRRAWLALIIAIAPCAGALGAQSEGRHVRTIANDNRRAAGSLRDGVLTVRLEARIGSWHPDGDSAPGALLPAFAEEGRAPQIPGPLIRVSAGTDVVVTLRNRLVGDTIVVYGLQTRYATTSATDSAAGISLAPGEIRTLRFRLDAPGTYYYWGTTMRRPIFLRTREDAQLTGAIVVDPREASAKRRADRIMVIGAWTDTSSRAFTERKRVLAVINGRSWPHTERLTHAVGDTVRWRVINASADAHPMHLHGFYFGVDSRGDGVVDTTYAAGSGDRVVTQNLSPGGTMSMSWVPERPGNWLFHCHIPEHFARRGSLGMPPRAAVGAHAHRTMNHALDGMGGLVMGVTVFGVENRPSRRTDEPRRRLRLLVRRNAGGTDSTPYFGYTLPQGASSPAPDSGLRYGPPIVLTRGEAVSIMVVNQLSEPTAVHWHGIELDSYFDGVAGFSGIGRRISPPIAARDSFEARFTPPRAGTFIYHTHVDEDRQLLGGLAGPLIVLEPGQRFEPGTDRVVLITSPTSFADQKRGVMVNGSMTPETLVLRAGVTYRLRVVNMTMRRPGVRLELMRDSAVVAWRVLAVDGADLPDGQRASRTARRAISVGETFDVEVMFDAPGELRLDMRLGGIRPPNPILGSLPVRVVP